MASMAIVVKSTFKEDKVWQKHGNRLAKLWQTLLNQHLHKLRNDHMLAKYIGRTGTNGFVNGNVYRLKYEYAGGIMLVSTPKGKLNFAIESKETWRKNFRKVGH